MVAAVKAAAALEGQAEAGLRQGAGAAAAGAGMPVLSGRLTAMAVVAAVVVPPACQSPSFPHATSFRRIYSGPHTIKSTTKTQSYPPAGEADVRDTWRKDKDVVEPDRAFHCKGGATKPGRCSKSQTAYKYIPHACVGTSFPKRLS